MNQQSGGQTNLQIKVATITLSNVLLQVDKTH
jgi:hypothetical protein